MAEHSTATWFAWNDTSKVRPYCKDADKEGRVVAVAAHYGEDPYVEALAYDIVRDFPEMYPKWARIPEPLPGTYNDMPDNATELDWIKASDKLPTEADADCNGLVLMRARTSWQGVWAYYSLAERLSTLLRFWDPDRYWWVPFPEVPKEVNYNGDHDC